MLHFPAPATTRMSMIARQPPKRADSLLAMKSSLFNAIEDDLRDAKRVYTHGQEDDLRVALNRVVGRVEEIAQLLKESYATQTDLQTQLTLTNSNLQLALSNNEILEDALKRDTSGRAKDVGWRRTSKEEKEREAARMAGVEEEQGANGTNRQRRGGSDEYDLTQSPISPETPVTAPMSAPVTSSTSTNNTGEGRFFRFRFGSSGPKPESKTLSRAASPTPSAPSLTRSQSQIGKASPDPSSHPHPLALSKSRTLSHPHLTSASLPSLVPPTPSAKEYQEMSVRLDALNQKLEDMKKELEVERTARKRVHEEKERVEGELESLSQALFEEANKMVASERIKRFETEEELRQTLLEKEALREAMRVVEGENGRLRGTKERGNLANGADEVSRLGEGSSSGVDADRHTEMMRKRSSSAVAVKSNRSSAGSAKSFSFIEADAEHNLADGQSHAQSLTSPPLSSSSSLGLSSVPETGSVSTLARDTSSTSTSSLVPSPNASSASLSPSSGPTPKHSPSPSPRAQYPFLTGLYEVEIESGNVWQ